jgi:hypothetical protein
VGNTLSGLERTLSENVLTEEQLLALTERIKEAEADNERAPLLALAGERCTGIDAFTMPPQRLAPLWTQGPNPATAAPPLQIALLHIFKLSGLRDRDFHFYLTSLGDFVSAARLPYPERTKKSEELAAGISQQLSRRRWLFLSRLVLPNLDRFFDNQASAAAQLRAAKIAVAIERHRLAHRGELPPTLDELAPQYLPTVPEDTFEHQPLEFERLPKGYRVLSPGATAKRGPGTSKKPLPPVGFVVKR